MAGATETKDDRKYTKDHEWALTEGDELLVGITAFAVDQLGDVTLVGIDVKVGASVNAHQPFGTIESVKTLSDLFAPISGTITRINKDLENQPELVNADCYAAWMVSIQPAAGASTDGLLDSAAYEKLLASLDH